MVGDSNRETLQQYREMESQLMIGLKFHFGKSLQDLPLDRAVDVMVKAWESCQENRPDSQQNILDRQPRRITSSRLHPR